MRGNSFGSVFVLTTFGESHGPALGAVVDGCPAGLPLREDDLRRALARRRPGHGDLVSPRHEADDPEILSGVLDGITLGTPIAVLVRNTDARSADYDPAELRPGHADRPWRDKYGIRDHRGGGRSSGRETLGRVIGGAIARILLPPEVTIHAFTRQIGPLCATSVPDTLTEALIDAHPVRCPDPTVREDMAALVAEHAAHGDSLGGVAELWIDNVPSGLGEPVFHKSHAALTAALMSVGAVRGVSLGDAAQDILLPGSRFHEEAPDLTGLALRSHGIQGGLTTGQRIVLRVFVKPPSTLGAAALRGRHDACILPRVLPVLEAMAALVLADLLLLARLDWG